MSKPKTFWQTYSWVGVAILCLAVYGILQSTWLLDTLKGWGYEPALNVAMIEADLDLTDDGRRIFRATQPLVESSDDFNEHCNSHDAEVSLLGCYTDGKIYIYEIQMSQLESANKVTAAHELLHAAWERMGKRERNQVSEWLQQLYQDRREWFDSELEVYDEADKIEEMYTRAGTKLADLPEELEAHYAKYFRNRAQIVQFYQDYEAPFLALQLEMDELADKIDTIGQRIETERELYLQDLADLDVRIDQFNQCAATANCFSTEAEFTRRRSALLAERTALENMRTELNAKIAENNQRVQDYRERRAQLGELSNAMNSNIKLVETIK